MMSVESRRAEAEAWADSMLREIDDFLNAPIRLSKSSPEELRRRRESLVPEMQRNIEKVHADLVAMSCDETLPTSRRKWAERERRRMEKNWGTFDV